MKKAIILICIMALQLSVIAQIKYSYLYIEVNENLPVQVMLNNAPIENQHKGYIIVPKIAQGVYTLEFNFTNPIYTTHIFKFTADGQKSRGFRLSRVSDNHFVLQDVVNKSIINEEKIISTQPIAIASNKKIEASNKINKVEKNMAPEKKGSVTKKEVEKEKTVEKVNEKRVVSENPTVLKRQTVDTTTTNATYAMYREQKTTNPVQSSNRYKNYNKAKRESQRLARLNRNTKVARSNVPKAVNDKPCNCTVRTEHVNAWTVRLNKKYDDEARANYIRRNLGKNNITTNNLSLLVGKLETQIGRYKLIKMLYPKIADPDNIDRINKYFTSASYLEKIKELQYVVN